jgi:hypothetical protein
MTHLSGSFQQAVPAARLYQPRREWSRPVDQPIILAPLVQSPASVQISPFQFRLPPPVK